VSKGQKQGSGGLALLSLGALGVVFGDIGTSPLYALREAFLIAGEGGSVTSDEVFGMLSLVFWSLFMVVTIKYLIFVMRADNHGEGGILALTALILDSKVLQPAPARRTLIVLGLFGTALLYGDGMITPAISVLAAVEGLQIAVPDLGGLVVPIASAILIGLFSIQKFGTARVGAVFGPVMIVWFGTLAILGVRQIALHPAILEAVNPLYGLGFITSEPRVAFRTLGAIFLVVTGSEALYADMGHFGRNPIRLAWFTVVLPGLVLNYFGQGALVLADPAALDNPFVRLAPGWALVPLVLLSTVATIIASQALISGAYSLTLQAVQLGYLPRLRIDHTSPSQFGQVYVPTINWLLMVASVALVVGFQSSGNLAAAYGIAVTTTMVITALLLYMVMRERWAWGMAPAAALTAVFLVIDAAYFGANILKFLDGGWVPLVVGFLVFTIMTTWRQGRSALESNRLRSQPPVERFIGSIVDHPQERVPRIAVYMVSEIGTTPAALLANLRHHEVLHEVVALVTVRMLHRPVVLRARRTTIYALGEGFVQITLTYGFMEQPRVPEDLASIVSKDFGFEPEDASYFLSKESIVVETVGFRGLGVRLFSLMHRNALGAAGYFGLPLDRVIEVGSQVEM